MSDPVLIYGATGYSGRLLTRYACEIGLRPILCGRNPAKLEAVARPLDLEYRVATIVDPETLAAALCDVQVVINTAGPFSQTARPVVDACLRASVHYLDITAEVSVIESLAQRDAEARRGQVMLMPAVGFDVVPSDCLAAHVVRRLPRARRLAIGVTNMHFVTRASAKTLFEAVNFGAVRRRGVLARVPLGSMERMFDYGDGPRPSINVSLGDLVTSYYTTGVPNIETYVDGTPLMRGLLMLCRTFGPILATAPGQAWLAALGELLPEDPTNGDASLPRRTMTVVVEAEDGARRRARARLCTPEAYAFTRVTAAAVIARVLSGDLEVGFQTAARVYGSDFVLSLPDVRREDLE